MSDDALSARRRNMRVSESGITGNGGASAGENSAEAETGTETETGNEIRMLKADEETEKYVDYFPADGAYSLCEYNAPEEIEHGWISSG